MRWRLRFRFRLITLLVVITALCVWLGVTTRQARTQQQAVARLQELGADIFFDYQQRPNGTIDKKAPPHGLSWAREWLGDEYFRTVVYVRLRDVRLTDHDLHAIWALNDLKTLQFYRVDLSAVRLEPMTDSPP